MTSNLHERELQGLRPIQPVLCLSPAQWVKPIQDWRGKLGVGSCKKREALIYLFWLLFKSNHHRNKVTWQKLEWVRRRRTELGKWGYDEPCLLTDHLQGCHSEDGMLSAKLMLHGLHFNICKCEGCSRQQKAATDCSAETNLSPTFPSATCWTCLLFLQHLKMTSGEQSLCSQYLMQS